jgi:hypothetical protein
MEEINYLFSKGRRSFIGRKQHKMLWNPDDN